MAPADSYSVDVDERRWKPSVNPWLIAAVVSMAAFMEVLDTSIANVALPHIAGALGASNDESTWVLTSYLVSNAIVLPIAGWMVNAMGRQRYFVVCLAVFTLSSLFCGMATSLPMLLVARVVQGAGGGGLQPMAQAIMLDSFPKEKQGLAAAVFAVSVFAATAVGPTLGGWITDDYSWRWIFLIKIPLCVVILFLIPRLIEDPPSLKRLRGFRFDYIGFSLLVLGVGALQIFLDKGQEDDWFGSRFITSLVILSAVCLAGLVIWEWQQKEPIMDVRLFKNVNFSASCLQMFFIGVIGFASIVLMPQFLQRLLGYSAALSGQAVSMGALVLFITMPAVGQLLMPRIQARYLLASGWILIAASLFITCMTMTLGMSFRSASWVCVVQRIPIGLIYIPGTLAAYFGMAEEQSNSISGIVNFVRNIGSSVGTSFVTTVLARRAQFHQTILASGISQQNASLRWAAAGLAVHLGQSGLERVSARMGAYAEMYTEMVRQSAAMSFVDAYWLLGIASALMFFTAFLVRRNRPVKSAK